MIANEQEEANPAINWEPFVTSKTVQLAREHKEFINCPVCGSFEEKYLFHDSSGRHVRCNNCFFVFVNPLPRQAPLSTILNAELTKRSLTKRLLMVKEVTELVSRSIQSYKQANCRAPNRVLLLGAITPEIIKASK